MKIYVNGRPKELGAIKYVTYEELMLCAFEHTKPENIILTGTYKYKNGKGGSLTSDSKIKLESEMVFNIHATNRA